MKAERGDEALRRFRHSQPGADYFITANLTRGPAGVLCPGNRHAIRRELESIETDRHWRIRGAVIMPDHVHLLVTLGETMTLDRVMARFKSKTRASLLAQGLQWQTNFYEHRLRAWEDPSEIIRYLFLNPHRAGLTATDEIYAWFWLGAAETGWFQPQTDCGRPFPEWLR